MSLIPRQSHEKSPKTQGQNRRPVLFVTDVKDTAVHDVFVVVGERRFVAGRVGKMIGGGTIQVKSRSQNQGNLVGLPQRINFAVNVQEKVAFKGGSKGLDSVHSIKFVSVGIQSGNFENILEEGHFCRRVHSVLIYNLICVKVVEGMGSRNFQGRSVDEVFG